MNSRVLVLLLLSVTYIPTSFLHAYATSAHQKLTATTFAHYGRLRPASLFTPSDIADAQTGSVDEDDQETHALPGYLGMQRALNHFYDPIHNVGLHVASVRGLASPVWLTDTKAQADIGYHALAAGAPLFSGDADFSWERSVYEYVHGDRKRAMQGLGHALHILQDATSPAHTRNDPHTGVTDDEIDPYEEYTADRTPHVTLTQFDVPTFTSPEEAIQKTALYTNTHFFSSDTVEGFDMPRLSALEVLNVGGDLYGFSDDIPVIKTNKYRKDGVDYHTYSYPRSDSTILGSNWTALSRVAVANGVALIDRFEKDVAEEMRTHALLQKNLPIIKAVVLSDARVLAQGFGTAFQPYLATPLTANALDAITPAPPVPVAVETSSPQPVSSVVEEVFPESTAFVPSVTQLPPEEQPQEHPQEQPHAETPPPPAPATNPGGLSSFGFGSGAGGGGGSPTTESTSPPSTPPTPPTPVPTCTPPHTLNIAHTTCILPERTLGTLLPDTFTEDTTLSYAQSPYISKPEGAQTVHIPHGITVTIEAGALLKLAAETRIVIDGTLTINGTAPFPVIITSLYDDTVFPVTNTDTALSPQTHPWTALVVKNGGILTASYTTLRFGGWLPQGTLPADFPQTTLYSEGTTTITTTTITDTDSSCLIHAGGMLTIDTLTCDHAPTQGLTIRAPHYDIQHAAISNTPVPVALGSLLGRISDTHGEANTMNGIVIAQQTIAKGDEGHLYANPISYYTEAVHTIQGTLTFHTGVCVQHAGAQYVGEGTFRVAEGETGTPPLLTSLWDNAHTGTACGTVFPNNERLPILGDWGGVVLLGGEVRFGGR